jgi:levanase
MSDPDSNDIPPRRRQAARWGRNSTAALALTRRAAGFAALLAALTGRVRAQTPPAGGDPDRYRPLIHYAPRSGFMNDPNGLIFHDGEWHLFFQLNPYEPRAGRVHWGHAVSHDLLHWRDLPIALDETAAGQAFSGSAVFDAGNTSGLFTTGTGGLVAIYTRASPGRQRQEIAFSRDGGRTFTEYAGNPVLDRHSDSFRDPKVLWHAPTALWIMVVAAARERRVLFYASPDLKRWAEVGAFGPAGVLGGNYECPDLVKVPVEGGGERWVLFVSINPGAPQGGSAVQYFVGSFDGARFTPDDAATRFADFGKDFYALQTFADVADGQPAAMAWASNWQYCNDLPTGLWRGVMSLPRLLSLRQAADGWRLLQGFVPLDPVRSAPIPVHSTADDPGHLAHAPLPPGGAVEVRMRLVLEPGAVAVLRWTNSAGEVLEVGFDQAAAQVFVDRGGTRGFSNRFFTDKFACAGRLGTREVDLHLVFDRCLLEVLAFGGEVSGTFLHFFAAPPDRLSVEAVGLVAVRLLEATRLAPKGP